MSKRLAQQVARRTTVTGPAREVLLAIARLARGGVAEVSLQTVADATKSNRNGVRWHVQNLLKRGEISRTERQTHGGRSWAYRIERCGPDPLPTTTSSKPTRSGWKSPETDQKRLLRRIKEPRAVVNLVNPELLEQGSRSESLEHASSKPPPHRRASAREGRGEKPVDVYAETSRKLGLDTPPDEELALVARKARGLLADGAELDDVLEACRRAVPGNGARFLVRIHGEVKRERLGIATSPSNGTSAGERRRQKQEALFARYMS